MPNYNSTLQTNNSSLEEIITQLNNMPDAGGEQATPVISVNNSNGLITATAGTKSSTYQMAFKAAQTITPTTTNQTIAANTYLGGVQTIKGDANLVASNIVSGKSIFGVVGTATTGSGGGGTSVEDSLVTKTVATYTNNRITSIGSYAFYACSRLTSVSFPKATSIGEYAFFSCESLTSVSFPGATSIGSYAFQYCSRLTSVSFPKVTSIGSYAFYMCGKLASISFPVATSIGSYAFQNCGSLTSVSFPKATSIEAQAFYYCSRLTSVKFPVATSISMYAFYSCGSLTSVSFPMATTIGMYAFQNCSRLTSVSFPKVTSIISYAFRGCSNLNRIYLMGSSVCTLANSNAFSNTGIGSNKGYIFVPASLVGSYKSATNWTYFSNRIFNEGGFSGGTNN